MNEYLEKIEKVFYEIDKSESKKMQELSIKIKEVIKCDGLIHIFGCGHSHIPVLDTFYRAGGLGNVSAMLDSDLMLDNGAAKSSRMEKMSGIALEIYRRYNVKENDILFIFSLSGKNTVPCELAEIAKKNGVYVVGISSSEYIPHGGNLQNNVNCYIDCKVPYGDACMNIGELKMGELSTFAFCYIINKILLDGAKLANDEGIKVPIYMSGNIEGGRTHNIEIENKYLGRIKNL